MRRRKFLACSAVTLAGFVAGRALARPPCPPALVSVSGGNSVRSTCAKPIPEWFIALKPLRWVSVASGPDAQAPWQAGDRLAEVVPQGPYFGGWGPKYLTAGWNGACVDSDNRQMILALNGGHAAWQYNDAYELDLNGEVPTWRRIVDATPEVDPSDGRRFFDAHNNGSSEPFPDGYMDRVLDPNGHPYLRPLLVPGWLGDGPQPPIEHSDRSPNLGLVRRRPRTLHTCSHYHYSNGRVWYPIMNGWNHGTGLTSLVKLALDMDALRQDPGLRKWRYADPGPWRYLGTISEQTGGDTSAFGFGVAALDQSTGKIWYVGQRTSSYWSMDTRGPAAGQHAYFNDSPREKDVRSSGGAIAHALPVAGGGATSLFVIMEIGTYRLWVFDISKAGTGKAWSVVTPANAGSFEWGAALKVIEPGFSGYPAAYGMVYHESSRCFFAYNCDQMPNRAALRKLSIPLRKDGTYDPEGSWAWSEVVLSGQAPAVNNPTSGNIGGGGGSYTRFNIFPDFAGTGEALLVHLSQFDEATSVCKLPPSKVG